MKINRIFWVSGALGFAAVSAFAYIDSRRIRVESDGNRREYKRVDTSGGVRLVKRLSDKPCIQGVTWGYDRNGIWTDRGCRAEFEVREDDRRNDRWDNRRDDRWDDRDNNRWNDRDTFKLESNDDRYKSKSINTRGGVQIVKRLSDKPCIQGRTWGYERDRVWVDNGCRAIFEVGRGGGGYQADYSADNCPSWLPGRYSGNDNGREFILNIDRSGKVNLRRQDNGRWSNDESGYYRDNAVYVGNWIYQVDRERDNVHLRSKWDSKKRISLRKL